MIARSSSAATGALLHAVGCHDTDSWLVPGGPAAFARGLAGDHPASTVYWQPVDLRERDALGSGSPNITIDEPGATIAGVDAVVIAAPPDRDLVRRWLLMARSSLPLGGHLFLAGANSEGIRSAIADAAKLFGPAMREDYRARGRIAVWVRTITPEEEPAWAEEPGVAPGTWRGVVLETGDVSLPIVTQAGVFAGGKVDTGTQLLLDALPGDLSGRVLDVGCGAGAIGIAAARRGAGAVDFIDVNLLAIQAAKENIRRLGLAGCRAFGSDVYAHCGGERYDLIVSNPPFHRGKEVDHTVADRLIEGAADHLRPGGSLIVVVNAFLAYGKRMGQVFGQVETVVATRQFHVLRASKPR